MDFNEKQIKFICSTSKHIILEQPEVLAERITEMFTPTQDFKSRELIEYTCKHSIHEFTKSLKNKDFSETEIKCCTLFISIFTRRIIKISTQLFEKRFYEFLANPSIMKTKLTGIINDVSSTEIKYFETRFNNFLKSYPY